MNLIPMPGRSTKDLNETLTRAAERIDECDDIIIVMQKRGGGLLWFGPDKSTAQTMIFLLQSALFHFNCMISGMKL